ncbi:MAG: hypothetical protein CO129_01615 [Ignavibacteriales bacterium CG_4_9_14_3_um_filter_34_10]|nr:MAG: hypothetical protein CO129_01615 [Ignavibacteriales bacterium CG_4_9_14_3_um_filter_34_10]
MKKIILLFAIALQSVFAQPYFEKDGEIYLKDKIVIKIKSEFAQTGLFKTTLENLLSDKFGVQIQSIKNAVKTKDFSSELSNIKILEFSSATDIFSIIPKIAKMKEVAWAEPYYLSRIDLTPNDPSFSNQYSLKKINAESAWNISTGSPDVVIGIVDTGVDWDHPDLAANIWINQAEANGITGVDDDNNGYVDDIHGWDFGGSTGIPDNNPMEDRADHGTHVAGIAGAVTNNNIGIASIGFNCKIMPVKVAQENLRDEFGRALISYGYDGIVYAVDNGAKVINCSWGSYSFSQFGQEIIDYATSNGALVVAATGNENRDKIIYPANYNGALSVGYSNSLDGKDGSSNYGYDVDLFAPGSSIYSTWMNDSYTYLNGSSMASPLVAGLAGLVTSAFPNITPLQVAEIIRSNCDDIYSQNAGYEYLLGAGRVNAFKSLSNGLNSVSIRFDNAEFVEIGDNDGTFENNESINVIFNLTNFLSSSANITLSLYSNSNYVEIPTSSKQISSKNTLENFAESFQVNIKSTVPYNHEVRFRLEFNDGNFHGFQWTKPIIINPLYATHSAGKIKTTITSKGNIGFNDYPSNQQGDGFIFENGNNLLFEGGLIYGNAADKIFSCVRSSNADMQSNSFTMQNPFVIVSPGNKADEQGLGIFHDLNNQNSLGIVTTLTTYEFIESPNNNFIILHYKFSNNSQATISNFFAGLYFDWDMDESDYADNVAAFDDTGNFGYVFNSNGEPIKTKIALAVLSSDNIGFYGIHNNGEDGGFGVYDGFTDSEKWLAITNGLGKPQAGPYDISCVVSSGPYDIPSGNSLDVAFAIVASDSLELLRNAVANSKIKYNEIITDIKEQKNFPQKFFLEQNYPNPFNPSTTIQYSIPSSTEYYSVLQNVTLKVYDILGNEVATLVNEHKPAGVYNVQFIMNNLSSGVYFYTLKAGSFTETKKMLLLH